MEVINRTESKLEDCLRNSGTASGYLIYIFRTIYPKEMLEELDSKPPATIILQRIDSADRTILQLMPPVSSDTSSAGQRV